MSAGTRLKKYLYEEVESVRGRKVMHIKSSLFLWSAPTSLIVGVFLLSHKTVLGGVFLVTLAPFLILYPIVRFLLGGRDSLFGVLVTYMVEEVLKYKLANRSKNNKN